MIRKSGPSYRYLAFNSGNETEQGEITRMLIVGDAADYWNADSNPVQAEDADEGQEMETGDNEHPRPNPDPNPEPNGEQLPPIRMPPQAIGQVNAKSS